MSKTKTTDQGSVVLAIYPHRRAIGYAVMNSPTSVIISNYRHKDFRKMNSWRAYVSTLFNLYLPDAIILESGESRRQYRGERVLEFFSDLEAHIRKMNIPIHYVSRKDIRTTLGIADKYEMNDTLVERFPRLADKIPKRRVWDSGEPESQCAFDALSLAYTYYILNNPTPS